MDRAAQLGAAGDAAVLRHRRLRRVHVVRAKPAARRNGRVIRVRTHPPAAAARRVHGRHRRRGAHRPADLGRSRRSGRHRRLPVRTAAVVPRRVPALPGSAAGARTSARARAVADDRTARRRCRDRGCGAHHDRRRGVRHPQPRLRVAGPPAARLLPRRRPDRVPQPPNAGGHRCRRRRRAAAQFRGRHPLHRSDREHQPSDDRAAARRGCAHHADVAHARPPEHVERHTRRNRPAHLHHAARDDDLPLAHAGPARHGRRIRRALDRHRTRPPSAQQPRMVDDAPAVAGCGLHPDRGRRHRTRAGRIAHGSPSHRVERTPGGIRRSRHRGHRRPSRPRNHASHGRDRRRADAGGPSPGALQEN
ncbi:hypothetical protein SRABI121_01521 [Microbacterium sp. Bi121]|nr:hypothetical protein SRABI121_01521 [Microbacterium sp. Bi121]